MGMIDFGLKKKSNDFSSVKGSRHFPRVRFLSEQSYIDRSDSKGDLILAATDPRRRRRGMGFGRKQKTPAP
jgi:hypothetical protein